MPDLTLASSHGSLSLLSPLTTLACFLLNYYKPLTVSKPLQLLFPLPGILIFQILFEWFLLILQVLAPNSFAQEPFLTTPSLIDTHSVSLVYFPS